MSMAEDTEHRGDIWKSFEVLGDHHWVTHGFSGRGDLEFEGQLRFAGHWTGYIRSKGEGSRLYVIEGAKISGRLEIEELTVAGTLEDVQATVKRLVLLKGARVFGRVQAESVQIHEGAIFQGQMTRKV